MVRRIEVGSPIITEPDWPARKAFAFPQSQATLIIPRFDTAAPPPALGTRTLAVSRLSWGFQEPWKPGVVFNTRIESAGKPTWSESMQHRRCIIPVPSFFETHHEETIPSPKTGRPIKRQYEFRMPESPIILIGCIWKEGCFSMVTTEANAHMAPIHHRMPLIVRQDVFGNGFLDTLAARFRQSGKRTADVSDFCLPEHQGLVHPLARAVELDESSMVDHPVDHRGGKLVVAQDRSPFAELDVGGEHHTSLLVAC